MNCTHAEAAEKWCPFVRISMFSDDFPFSNRGQKMRLGSGYDWKDIATCIGPDCMLWMPTSSTQGYCGTQTARAYEPTSPRAFAVPGPALEDA
jgi:hypothetical protein